MIIKLVNLLVILAIVYLLYQKAQHKPLKFFFFPGLIFKLFMGVAVGLIYKYYYNGGDTYNLFHDAVVFSDLVFQSPLYYLNQLFDHEIPLNLKDKFLYAEHPRALITSKIFSFFTLITNNNYWITGLYLSLFSFSGMWYLANKLAEKYPGTVYAAAAGFLLFPSVVFWSSGVLKESLIMGLLSFLFGFMVENLPKPKKDLWKKFIWIFICLVLIWLLKYYYLAVLLAVSITTICTLFVYNQVSRLQKKPSSLIILWIIFFAIFFSAATQLYPTLLLDNFLFYLLDTHDTIYRNSIPENLIHYNNLNADFRSLLINLPKAFFAGLFRPGIWDVNSILQLIPALENLFILISSLLILKNLFKSITVVDKILLYSLIVYILILAVLMAFASPNFGTLMRYKIGFLPFLIYLVCINNPIFNLKSKFIKKKDT